MKFKILCSKLLLTQINCYWKKRLILSFCFWKLLKLNEKNAVSRIPKSSSKKSADHYSKILKEAANSKIQLPRSLRSSPQPESPIDLEERIIEKGEKTAKRKESSKKSLGGEKTSAFKVSPGTPNWPKGKMKIENFKAEDIAVVSGNSILQYTSYSPNLKEIIQNKFFTQNKEFVKRNEPRILSKKDRPLMIPSFAEDLPKENYYGE